MSPDVDVPAPGAAHSSAPPSVRAVLDAGAVSTTYVRAGSGAPVLLLHARARTDAADARLFCELSRRFRVIAPDVISPIGSAEAHGATGVAFSCWLRDLLDGLGLARASVVADERVAARVLQFALAQPGRVDRLVFVYHDVDDPQLPANQGPDHLGHSGHPLLVLRVRSDCSDPLSGILASLIEFIDGGADGAD